MMKNRLLLKFIHKLPKAYIIYYPSVDALLWQTNHRPGGLSLRRVTANIATRIRPTPRESARRDNIRAIRQT